MSQQKRHTIIANYLGHAIQLLSPFFKFPRTADCHSRIQVHSLQEKCLCPLLFSAQRWTCKRASNTCSAHFLILLFFSLKLFVPAFWSPRESCLSHPFPMGENDQENVNQIYDSLLREKLREKLSKVWNFVLWWKYVCFCSPFITCIWEK